MKRLYNSLIGLGEILSYHALLYTAHVLNDRETLPIWTVPIFFGGAIPVCDGLYRVLFNESVFRKKRPLRVSLKVVYGEMGEEYLDQVVDLDSDFRRTVNAGPEDSEFTRQQVREGERGYVVALLDGKEIGMQRFDLDGERITWNGVFVVPEYRGNGVDLEETPWLSDGEAYTTWQYLRKSVYVLGRRAGFREFGNGHKDNEFVDRAERLMGRDTSLWNLEADSSAEPSEILDEMKRLYSIEL